MNDQRKTKKQLIDELEELRGSKDVFRDIAEQSADAIVTADLSGRVTYGSPGATKMSGYTAEEILGTRLVDFYLRGGYEEAKFDYPKSLALKDVRGCGIHLSQ